MDNAQNNHRLDSVEFGASDVARIKRFYGQAFGSATQSEHTSKRVKRSGAGIRRDVFSSPGGWRFHCADPSGNEPAVWPEQPEGAHP